jgi:putative peptidoglycan lipid II flippase
MSLPSINELRKLARQFASAIGGTVIGNALGAVLPFAVAFWFGSGAATDAYFYALGVVLFLNAVLSLAIEASTTPFVVELKLAATTSVWKFVRRVAWQSAGASAVVTAVVTVGLGVLVVPSISFTGEQQEGILRTLVILAPLPVFVTVNAVLAGTHYAYGRFFLATSSVASRSLFALLFGILLQGEIGIDSVAYGLVLGEILRTLLLASSLFHLLRVSSPPAPEPAKSPARPVSTRAFWRAVVPQVAAVALGSVNLVVDRTVAAPLGVGRVTILELTQRLVFTPILLVTSGIGVVLGSRWSRLCLDDSHEGRHRLRNEFLRTQRWTLLVSTGLAASSIGVVWALQEEFANAIGVIEPRRLATTFVLIAIGIPFALGSQIAVKLLIAARRTGLFPILASVSLLVNLALDVLLARHFDVAGIALASACVNVLNAVTYNVVALRYLIVRSDRQLTTGVPAPHNITLFSIQRTRLEAD